jgi:signal peptidase I
MFIFKPSLIMGNYIFLGLVLVSFFGLSKLFTKANVESWKAFIPFYNFYCLSKLLNKPWWWCLIMIVPGVNILMYGVYGFNVARAFNKPSNKDLLFASILPYIFFVITGFDKSAKFVGLEKFKKEPSSFVKNWLDPIVFAVIAASIIRGFFIEAFTIPTSSLEKSLMVGDFLFVNKFAYGPKIPQTPLSFPFAHHTLPLTTSTKSYLEWIKLPYFRLPGFGSVKNGDIVVFNYPDGDTVLLDPFMQNTSYSNNIHALAFQYEDADRRNGQTIQPHSYYKQQAWEYFQNPKNTNIYTGEGTIGEVTYRPKDKREHYVKRCIAIAGDKLEIKDGEVFINGQKQEMPKYAQHNYTVKCKGAVFGFESRIEGQRPFLSETRLLDKYDIYITEASLMGTVGDTNYYNLNMPRNVAEEIKQIPGVLNVERRIDPLGKKEITIFPHDPAYAWNNDNFGPLQIPKAGMSLPIDTHNICMYEKILSDYDDDVHHSITRNGAQVLYDGKPITSYTFKQGYYWMVGDNRHNSADSRSWGFVPFDHVVGSPFFVWFSMKYAENNPISGSNAIGSLFKNSKEGKFRWERFLCYVDDGNLTSIKIPFIAIILGIWGFSKWNQRRKLKLTPKK